MAPLIAGLILVGAVVTALFGYPLEGLVISSPGCFLLAYWLLETRVGGAKINHDELYQQQLMVEQTKLIRNIDRRDDLRK